MKTKLLIFLFLLALTTVKAQEYHFQQGFATSAPQGWTRNCAGTNSVSHGGFDGAYAAKFDDQGYDGETKALLSPKVPNGGKLTFWMLKNANATKMDLYVVKIVDGVESQVMCVPISSLSTTKIWYEFSVDINEPFELQLKFWAKKADGSTSYIAIDDIELTKYTGVTPPLPALERIETRLDDGTWGTPLANGSANLPVSGSYPSSEVNRFKLSAAVLYGNKPAAPGGGNYTNTIAVDKNSASGAIEFPPVKTVGEVEIHAMSGSDDKGYFLQEYVLGAWTSIGEQITTNKAVSVYKLSLERTTETRLRIANATGSALFVAKIIVRSLAETKELNVVSSVPAEGQVCYYNLTKTMQVTFNKNIAKGTGALLLNDVSISLDDCTITDGNTVSFPVSLTGHKSGNTDYALTIPAGAFVEEGNGENASNAATINFQTLKTANVPDNYNKEIDVLYSTKGPNCRVDIYWPSDATEATPLLVNTHGGGWNHGEKEAQSGFKLFTDMGFAVANVEYRMYPEATAPAAVEDLRSALIYMIKNAAKYHIDVNKIVMQGSSAGAHLVTTAAYLQNDRRYDGDYADFTGDVKVMAVIDRFGPVDLPEFMFYTSLANWLGEHSTDVDFVKSVSPVYLVNATTPPTYIVHGDADPTVPYSQSVTLYAALQAKGVKSQFSTVTGGGHGGFASADNDRVTAEIKAFLTDLLDSTSAVEASAPSDGIGYTIKDGVLSLTGSCGDARISVYNAIGVLQEETWGSEVALLPEGVSVVRVMAHDGVRAFKIMN